METYDAIIVGGGPAGSTCARTLVKGGLRVAVLDGAEFPRVKLCAGWISPPIWDVLEMRPRDYPLGLWEWDRGHLHYAGKTYTKRLRGYFVRRYEFDDFLLKRSKAKIVDGHFVRLIDRDSKGFWMIDKQFRAKYLVGAGGTHCPVARALFPKKNDPPITTQEREFEGDPQEIAFCRMGKDGEPELLLHDDLKGYSWNVPKTGWLNVGSGTLETRGVHDAWRKARAFFQGNGKGGHIPASCHSLLDQVKGHSYYIFSPDHLEACQRDTAFLVGDALGLAQPTTGEGILPAVVSGRVCAEAIVSGRPQDYRQRLEGHPVIRDYKLFRKGSDAWLRLKEKITRGRVEKMNPLMGPLIVTVFSALFSGKSIPGGRLIYPAADLISRLIGRLSTPPVKVKGLRFLLRMLRDPKRFYIPLMDAYVDGELEIDYPLTPIFETAFEVGKRTRLLSSFDRWGNIYSTDKSRTSSHAKDIKHHYDLETPIAEGKIDPKAFYPLWLGETMSYTMAYWPNGTKTLEEAQRKKLKLYQELADIQSGQDVYEPGFGFGSFVPYVLERKARWFGANLSSHQCQWVRDHYPEVEVREQDFLKLWKERGRDKKFDRIASIGNLEHIQKLDDCFAAFRRMLQPDGKLLVHLITHTRKVPTVAEEWLTTRIFPHGQFHSHLSLIENATPYFEIEYENIFPGIHYAKTLHEWSNRFEKNLDRIRLLGAPERFIRLWRIWLAASEAGFSKGLLQNSVFVFVPKSARQRPKNSNSLSV